MANDTTRPGWFGSYFKCMGILVVTIMPISLADRLVELASKGEEPWRMWLVLPAAALLLCSPVWCAYFLRQIFFRKQNTDYRRAVRRFGFGDKNTADYIDVD